MNSIKYVGADAHQATTTFSVRSETGKVTMRATVETKPKELITFVKAVPGTVHLTFEEGTQAAWLYETLAPHVAKLIVCNPRSNKLLGKGNKSDAVDADKLSDLLRGGFLTPVYHGEARNRELRALVRTYQKLLESSVRFKNQTKAVFRGRGISTSGREVYAPDPREDWLAKLTSPALRQFARATLLQLDLALKLRAEAEEAMLAEARRDRSWRNLQTVPGIGPIRAAQILGVLGTPHRFRTKRQLWSYSGLAVVTRSSADYGRDLKHHGRPATRGLNRNHNPAMKAIFKGAALDAIRSGLREYHAGLLESGMRPEMARLTVARKIAAVVLATWKKGEAYDPAKAMTQST